MKSKTLFPDYNQHRHTSRFKKVNPMVIKYGQLDGKTCKDCLYLEYHHGGNKYFTKCRLRGVTHGAGTDHLVNWEACNRWESEDDRTYCSICDDY